MKTGSIQLRFFNSDGSVSDFLQSIINDKSVSGRYKTLTLYCDNNNYVINEADFLVFKTNLRSHILSQCRYLAFLVYHYLSKSNEWGDAGKELVQVSFCRWVLSIPNDQLLSYDHFIEFEQVIETELKTLDIAHLPKDLAKTMLRRFEITICNCNIPLRDTRSINALMEFFELDWFFYQSGFDSIMQFVLFEGSKTFKMGYDVYLAQNELVRSPTIVVSLAALIVQNQILVRTDALAVVFYQKWVRFFDTNDLIDVPIHELDFSISAGIKQRALHLYGASSMQSLQLIQNQFISDMAETITHHEIGHGAVQNEILSLELDALGKGTSQYGETIFRSLLEFFADFVPHKGETIGPIQHMIDISKQDRKRAEGMYYMYFSDTWFFDTSDTYMFGYSTMLALVLLQYINDDLSIDFDSMEADIQFDSERYLKGPVTMYEKMIQIYELGILSIERKLKRSSFDIDGFECQFEKLSEMINNVLKKFQVIIDPKDASYQVKFWADVFNFHHRYASNAQLLESYILDQEVKLLKKIFSCVVGKKKAERYKYDYHRYIQSKCQRLGLATTTV